MSVKIGHAVGDENGKARGGEAGDQTGREVRIQDFYVRSGGWGVYLEPLSAALGARAADRMIAICENDNIGYDQDERWSARSAVLASGSIEEAGPSEIDCSSGIDIAYEAAGLEIERGYTGNLERRYMATGAFKAYRDAAHLNSGDYAIKGGIYLAAGKHVAMVLSNGSKAEEALPGSNDDISGEADSVSPPYVQIVVRGKYGVRVRTFPKTGAKIYGAVFGERLPFDEYDADTGWYCVQTPKGPGFITNNPRHTKLVT